MRTTHLSLLGAFGLTLLAGCTVKDVEVPALSGPSTFAQSLQVSANPDSILQDQSSSTVVVTARDANGQPKDNIRLRAQIFVDDVPVDFGTLVPKDATTGGGGSRGEARFTYTSPARPVESVGTGTRVTIVVTPVDTDAGSRISALVNINVIPPGVILPPNGLPVAAFVVTPTPAITRVALNFDASSSTDEGVRCGAFCLYSWDFGDGTQGSGMVTTHEYRNAGSFTVLLTVTDQRGLSGTATQVLTVAATNPPTATFSMSPTPVGINQDVFFDASASRPAAGRRIVAYNWNFGDGGSGSGVATSHSYRTVGTYTVTLQVTDDADVVGQSPLTITVTAANAGLTPLLTVSPSSASLAGTTLFFNAGGSTGTAPIVEYRFNWGDGSPDDVGVSATQSHAFPAGTGARTYQVRLTIRDSLGRTATIVLSVSVT